MINGIDRIFRSFLNRWGIDLLRISLGVVFVWFGALKVTGLSPVEDLVRSSFDFLPFAFPFFYLGLLEMFIGLGLLFKFALRLVLGVMWLMLLGTFASLIFNPTLFFDGNILRLTVEGEFVVKNLILVTGGMVIGGFETKP